MQRTTSVTLAPAALSANGISLSQKPAAGGVQALTITGALASAGVATLPQPRRVGITSSADDTGRVFTVTGTDRYDRPLTEALVGPGTGLTVSTINDFKTVTGVSVDANTAGNITVGTSGVMSSQWIPLDRVSMENLGIGVHQTGVANWTVEYTMEDPFTPGVGFQPDSGIPSFYLTPYPNADLTAQAAKKAAFMSNQPATAIRLTINSFTAPATVTMDLAPGFANLQ
jgi:hypothetical protein